MINMDLFDMIFTQKDIENIAKNIKTIRLAYGYKTQLDFALALDPNARYPGLSHDMIKKYESGSYPITEQAVRLISSLTLFPFEDIVFGNLDDLEPDSLVLGSDEELDFTSEDFLQSVVDDMNKIFPLFSDESLMKNELFARAMNICKTRLNVVNFKEEDMNDAINSFSQFICSESYLNIMSLLGRLYATYIYKGIDKESFEELKSKDFKDTFEYAKEVHKRIGYSENCVKEAKRRYLDAYNCVLTKCMQEAAKEDKYKDYVYYYLGVRYYFGIMDNDITKLCDEDMNSFGINMLDCLDIIGNKYAKHFKETLKP